MLGFDAGFPVPVREGVYPEGHVPVDVTRGDYLGHGELFAGSIPFP
jgi:hypothetical protein